MVRLPGVGAGRAGRSEFGAGWFRDSARLPQPALHRGAHRVPAEDPALMTQAILAAEDERFYQHTGVDYQGVLRAAYSNLVAGGKTQGASTITMQVARDFFLSREKTLTRKLYEALLAFKIENSLTKDQILEIYINQIYLGQRAYGFGAAAQVYFGKTLSQLNSAEIP